MTIIVAIKCKDGIVVGSDGAATFGSLGRSTIVQPMATKLQIIQRQIILGVSGPVGLGQFYADQLATLWEDKEFGRGKNSLAGIKRLLRNKFLEDAGVAMSAAQVAVTSLGPGVRSSVDHSTVVAVAVQDRPELIQLDTLCQPEHATSDLPFLSIGSGQSLADPFLALLKRIFWKDSMPKLADGVFAAVWTLRHAIEVNPGGVSDPMSIATLTSKGKEWHASVLSSQELEEHEQNVSAAESHLAAFRAEGPAPSTDPPSPPGNIE